MKFKVGNQEFEVADEEVTKAVTEKKTSIELSADAIVRTPDEDSKFVENMKKAARTEGIEIAVKKSRETLGLSFEGKTIDNLISAVTDKVKAEAGSSESEKVTRLESKVREKDEALKTALQKATEFETSIKTMKSVYKIDKALDTFIPKDTVLPIDDVKVILKSKLKFSENESGVIEAFNLDGTPIQNPTTRDNLPVKDVIEDFFRTNTHYMKNVDGGGAGGDSTKGGGSGKMTIEKFNEDMIAKGYAPNSREYDAELNKAIVAKTLDIE